MRALVISDTHFGAWTGEDLLRHEPYRDRLAPHLEDVDEVIILGDLVDLLFGRLEEAFTATRGLLDLLRERLQRRRLVFVAGNHDHHLVTGDEEGRIERRLAGDSAPRSFVEAFLARHLEGVEVDVQYPTYTFGGVLCTHGHYLDPHSRSSGGFGGRLLARTLWSIAAGGQNDPTTIEDYESTTTLLTEMLYTVAQLPHGTTAQQNVFRAAGRVGQAVRASTSPMRAAKRLRRSDGRDGAHRHEPASRGYGTAKAHQALRMGAPCTAAAAAAAPGYTAARMVWPTDPREHALEAFERVVQNLGWRPESGQVVFGHTHQPLADVRPAGDGHVRYWNSGSWIYEPDASSRESYERYLENGWPGTAVVIDTAEPAPRLVETLRDLNPLHGGEGIRHTGGR
jgi:UDP-2,3-diacylglucosamine pyrophosphatase LpxH